MPSTLSIAGLATSLTVPLALGYSLLRLAPATRQWHWGLMMGHGYLIGIYLITLFIRGYNQATGNVTFIPIVSIALTIATVAFMLASLHGAHQAKVRVSERAVTHPFVYTLIALLGITIIVRIFNLALEISYRPLFPWDAWWAWTPKSLQYFDNRSLEASLFTIKESHGDTLNLIQLWTFLGTGTPKHSLNQLPWLLCFVSLLAALYGQIRTSGFSRLTGLAAVYTTCSVPFLFTHTALAGMADIWATLGFTLGLFALAQYIDSRNGFYLFLIAIYAAFCLQIKQAGAGLAGIVVGLAAIYTLFYWRIKWGVVGSTATIGAGIVSLGALSGLFGLKVPLPLIGTLEITSTKIMIPGLGQWLLSPGTISQPLVESLFLFHNWHLLTTLFLFTIAMSFLTRSLNALRHCFFIGTLLTILYVMLYHFFVAPESAIDHTGLSRAIMYCVPVCICWILQTSECALRNSGGLSYTRHSS